MVRLILAAGVACLCISVAIAAPISEEDARGSGILVLDNCDDQYEDQDEYHDNLTMFGSYGKQRFRVSGFNNCQLIGSFHLIATDRKRECVWVLENVAMRIRRFNLAGKETQSIPNVRASAIAIDPDTGNVWALTNINAIDAGATVVFSPEGKVVARHNVCGWDIVYDPKAKAMWTAGKDLTKIDVKTGAVSLATPIALWCSSSIDVDPNTGDVWVAVREHPEVLGSSNQLLKFNADGKELVAIPMGEKSPFRVSVDSVNASVWVANFKKSVERYSSEGALEKEIAIAALAVQVDPAGGDAWVVTPTETVRVAPKGTVKRRVEHAAKTESAWITPFE
jgi:hypothetical protein